MNGKNSLSFEKEEKINILMMKILKIFFLWETGMKIASKLFQKGHNLRRAVACNNNKGKKKTWFKFIYLHKT